MLALLISESVITLLMQEEDEEDDQEELRVKSHYFIASMYNFLIENTTNE